MAEHVHECGIESVHKTCACVICGEIYPNHEAAAPRPEVERAKTKRQIVYDFMGLPSHQQRQLAIAAGVFEEGDDDLIDPDKFPKWAKAAKEKGTVNVLLGIPAEPSAQPAGSAPKCANCSHDRNRHEMEPPYPCYDCECGGFDYVRAAPANLDAVVEKYARLGQLARLEYCKDGECPRCIGALAAIIRKAVEEVTGK